ncbi:MAG TPA: response regulator, partial [Aggregatilineales bacterium]|nr:response regulator [Aggregatilineales bacterium]
MTKILVIEDEAPLRHEIMEWLTFEGYEAIGAVDGVDGVNHAVLHSPDLIICDISMPRLDGYGVLLDVQANSAIQSTPFIFLSAKADLADVRKGMQLGADDYVTKPFNRTDLLQAIRTRLDKQSARDTEFQDRIDIFRQALALEHQQRLLHAKLVAMFSHDFRNQLTVITSSASLLRDYAERLTEERRTGRL